ncbi:MAG: AgmX/PglI C-terminal domain-containing protein [Polyangiaceae bacterium]
MPPTPSTPPPSMPPSMRVPPKNNNSSTVLMLGVFAVGIAALIFYKQCSGKDQPVTVPIPSASVSAAPSSTLVVDDLPLPPPEVPDATAPTTVKSGVAYDPCSVKTCSGATTSELESALAFRAKQAHRCYDSALANDSTLQGKVELQLRIASNGNVCQVDITGNDMGTPAVASCVSNWFRAAGHFPAPKGGCIDAKVPISFVPGGR